MKKIWAFVRAHWQIVLVALGAVVAVWAGRRVVTVAFGVLEGILVPTVRSPVRFVVHDATHVLADTPDGPAMVDVGRMGLQASKVTAVGWVGAGRPVEVQVANPPL